MAKEVHIPTAAGRAALEELDRVRWDRLTHAYGRGPQGATLDMDVEAALRALGSEDDDEREDAYCGLLSNVWHQGTIYEVTAHAVPFLAALAAGGDRPGDDVRRIAYFLGTIGAASCFVAPAPSHAGAMTRAVAESTRAAFGASRAHIENITKRDPSFAKLAAALIDLASSEGGVELRDRIQALATEYDGSAN